MFKYHNPEFNNTTWADTTPGGEGNDGWYSDEIIPGKRVIFFNGTWVDPNDKAPEKGYGDVLADLDIFPKRLSFNSDLIAHGGFVRYGHNSYETLRFAGLFDDNKPIIFIGHSLGASTAIFCALEYAYNYDTPAELYTIAGPSCTANRKTWREIIDYFPNFKNYDFGWDFTRWLWIITLPFGYTLPWKRTTIIKGNKTIKELGLFKWLVYMFGKIHIAENNYMLLPDLKEIISLRI